FRFPSVSVEKVRAVYPGSKLIQDFPLDWIQLEPQHSQVHLVPSPGSFGTAILGTGSLIFPFYGPSSYIPHFWAVVSPRGFDPERIPRIVIEAIAKIAVLEILKEMSDLLRPLGVNSESLSIDGLSQSRSYAIPAFKARIDQYERDLDDPNTGLIPQIRRN